MLWFLGFWSRICAIVVVFVVLILHVLLPIFLKFWSFPCTNVGFLTVVVSSVKTTFFLVVVVMDIC